MKAYFTSVITEMTHDYKYGDSSLTKIADL